MALLKRKKDQVVLGRDDILQADDIVTEAVDVPEWGGTVLVKGMSGVERDEFDLAIMSKTGKSREVNLENLRARLCASSIVDEDGNLIFTQEDVFALSEKSGAALQRVYDVASRLSGLGEDDIEELVEGLEDNPFEDSASD